MIRTAKKAAEICREWYCAFRNMGEGKEKPVLELFDFTDTFEALAAQPKWISADERLPKHKQVVLAYVDPCLEIVQFDAFDEMWKTDVGWFKLDSVTHWMPLPAPPEEDDGK